ncbi:MAG TPA: hypothetical protein ENN21_04385 [Spirochaetes bacterium]|nr:hypothetical protein [Spirochaetota bacterium]
MEYLLYFIGLAIGAAAFFYLLSLYHSGRERIGKMASSPGKKPPPPMRVEPRSIFHKKHGRVAGERICPLCGSVLTRSEALYAMPVAGDRENKILILGCRHCYSENEE